MPIVEPAYSPEPKSGWRVVAAPMKVMMLSELESTGAVDTLVFQRLFGANGTKPFRLAPGPVLMAAHVAALCDSAATGRRTKHAKIRMIRESRLITLQIIHRVS